VLSHLPNREGVRQQLHRDETDVPAAAGVRAQRTDSFTNTSNTGRLREVSMSSVYVIVGAEVWIFETAHAKYHPQIPVAEIIVGDKAVMSAPIAAVFQVNEAAPRPG
jgi:hypothetical protein